MARPPSAKLQTLHSFTKTGECQIAELAEYWGQSRRFATRRVHKYMHFGFIYRANPGTNPAIYKLTPKGAEQVAYTPPVEIMATTAGNIEFGIVAQAVKSQPISIFDYAARI